MNLLNVFLGQVPVDANAAVELLKKLIEFAETGKWVLVVAAVIMLAIFGLRKFVLPNLDKDLIPVVNILLVWLTAMATALYIAPPDTSVFGILSITFTALLTSFAATGGFETIKKSIALVKKWLAKRKSKKTLKSISPKVPPSIKKTIGGGLLIAFLLSLCVPAHGLWWNESHATATSGAINKSSVPCGAKVCEFSVSVRLSAIPTTSEKLIIQIDKVDGAAYDTYVFNEDLSVMCLISDVCHVQFSDEAVLLYQGDIVKVTFDNTEDSTYGVSILQQEKL